MSALNRFLGAGCLIGVMTSLMPTAILAQQRSGVEIWAQTCRNCHKIQPPNRYTPDQWSTLVVHMSVYTRMTDAEADAVLQFLQGGAKPVRLGPSIITTDPAELFSSLCSPCHGSMGKGDGPVSPWLEPRPVDLTDPELQRSRTDAELEAVLQNGKRSMPGFGNQLTPEQISALVNYVRSLGGK